MASSTTVTTGNTYDDSRTDLTASDTVTVQGGTYDDLGSSNADVIDVSYTLGAPNGGGGGGGSTLGGGGGPIGYGGPQTVYVGQAIDAGHDNTESVTVGAGATATDTGTDNADTVSVADGYVLNPPGWNHLVGPTTIPAGAYTDSGQGNADKVTLNGGSYTDSGTGNHDSVLVDASDATATDSGSHNYETVTVSAGNASDTGTDNHDTVNLEGGTFTEAGVTSQDTIDMVGGGTLVVQTLFHGPIENFNAAGEIIVEDGSGAGSAATSYSMTASSVTFDFASGHIYRLSLDTTGLTVTENGDQFDLTTTVCFASGTLIRTARGEVAVEDLAIGDLAVTTSGAARPIMWIGHRKIERPRAEQQPVRVRAGAFGEGLPARDLRLSHGHAVCVDAMGELLVPVGELVNGVTIVREEVAEVTYWHVELESHDVLMAEGLPCESYLDTGNRAFFGREHGRLAGIEPDRTLAASCRPFVAEGAILEAIRERLAARAQAREVAQAA
jgi:hypothetical protein